MLGIMIVVTEDEPERVRIRMTKVPNGTASPLEEATAQSILDAVHKDGLEKLRKGQIKGHYYLDPNQMLKHE